jgi:spore germination protein
MSTRSTGLVLLIFLLLFSGCTVRSESTASSGGLYVAAWLWRSAGLHTFCNTEYVKIFSEINPVWYSAITNATNSDITGTVNRTVITWAKNYGIKVIPTIQKLTMDSSAASTLDDANRAAHIAKIVALVVKNGFDGIDIDYEIEGLSAADKKNYLIFIQELGRALRTRNKSLSVCVYDYQSGVAWQNWAAMLAYVDTLKVMVYNLDVTPDPVPGPGSPLSGLEQTLNYVGSLAAAKGKIIIGLPLYGHHWIQQTDDTYKYTIVHYTDAIVQNGIAKYPVRRDDGEPYFTYQDSAGAAHIVYFQDCTALAERLKLIASYGKVVKGVTFWDLGGEDPLSWKEIAKYQ